MLLMGFYRMTQYVRNNLGTSLVIGLSLQVASGRASSLPSIFDHGDNSSLIHHVTSNLTNSGLFQEQPYVKKTTQASVEMGPGFVGVRGIHKK